jgi:putative two-component system response regulator
MMGSDVKGNPLTILLIEDNPGDARLIKELLSESSPASFSVDTADRLAQGMDYAEKGHYDAILLDLGLPDSRGLDTFTTLHTSIKHLPIVVLSGLNDESVALEAVQKGAQDYLVKGQVDGHILSNSIRYAIERKQAEEKLIKSYASVKKTLNDAINTMVKIVELRDPYTSGHQQKVAALTIAIAREMKLEDTRIDQLRTAAVIHDIGKIYIPSDILSKPGKLSAIEFSLIKTHAQSGYDIVKSMDLPGDVAQAVLQHHERLDGSGYPNRLKGDDTLLEAKILAVADVIEAMASHRPYRPALGIDKALLEIEQNREKLYDPDVVDICLRLFRDKSFSFEQRPA